MTKLWLFARIWLANRLIELGLWRIGLIIARSIDQLELWKHSRR